MAEPVSLVASVVELTNAGFSLGKFLNETWLSYKNAPAEVLEIAHEVTVCCELMTPLAEQLKHSSVRYTSRFQEAVEGLVKNSTRTFNNVRALIPRHGTLDKGILPKWDYVLKKNKIAEHRKKLKEVQQMFLFMKQMMLEAQPQTYQPQSSVFQAAGTSGPSRHFPLKLSGQGRDENGRAVTYHATLVMEPANINDELKAGKHKLADTKSKEEKSQPISLRPPRYLNSLRQNPYFSPELLEKAETRSDASRKDEREFQFLRWKSRGRESRKLSRSSTEDEGATQGLEIPDNNEAAEDVNELMSSWFGPEEGTRTYVHRPSLVVPETTSPKYQPIGSSPAKSPSSRLSPSSGVKSPSSPSPGSYFASVDTRPAPIYDCDGCQKEILGTRYECRSCKDYDLCPKCFNSPDITLRLKHLHPKSHFAEIRGAYGS